MEVIGFCHLLKYNFPLNNLNKNVMSVSGCQAVLILGIVSSFPMITPQYPQYTHAKVWTLLHIT